MPTAASDVTPLAASATEINVCGLRIRLLAESIPHEFCQSAECGQLRSSFDAWRYISNDSGYSALLRNGSISKHGCGGGFAIIHESQISNRKRRKEDNLPVRQNKDHVRQLLPVITITFVPQ